MGLGGAGPLAIPLAHLELGELRSRTPRSPLAPAAPVQQFPCAAAVGFGSWRGDSCLWSFSETRRPTLRLVGRREMKNREAGRVVFFLSLINSGSFAPRAFWSSATPAISGRVNWGQGSGRASGNSWGQCPEGSATPSPPWPSCPWLPPFS